MIALALYAQTLTYNFVWDDKIIISENRFVTKGLAGIGDILTSGAFDGAQIAEQNSLSGGRYRPLSMIMFAVEWQLFGGKPSVMHAINIILNAGVVVLLFGVLKLMQRLLCTAPAVDTKHLTNTQPNETQSSASQWRSLFCLPAVPFCCALLFAAHPTHTEAVANIKGRDEILCLLGSLGALYYILKAYLHDNPLRYCTLAAMCFAGALFSKESAVTFVFVIPFTLWMMMPQTHTPPDSTQTTETATQLDTRLNKPERFIALSLGITLALSIIFFFIRAQIVGFLDTRTSTIIVDNPFLRATTMERYATIIAVLGRYLVSAIYPFTLAADYSYNAIPIVGFTSWQVIASLIVYSVLLALALVGLREKHILSYCLWYYFATISIVSNLVFSIGALMGDRFLYMPSVGTSLLLVLTILWSATRLKNGHTIRSTKVLASKAVPAGSLITMGGLSRYAALAVFTLCVLYAGRVIVRNSDWSTEERLVEANVHTLPECIRMRRIHAGFLQRQAAETSSPLERAALSSASLGHLQACLAVDSTADPRVYFGIGQYYSMFRQRYDSAGYFFRRASELAPNETHRAFVILNEANRAAAEQRLDTALALYRQALAFAVQRENTFYNIGVVLSQQQRYAEAAEVFRQMTTEYPNNQQARAALQFCLEKARQ